MNSPAQTPQQRFATALKDMQSAERQLAQAMPQLVRAANDLGLQAELEKSLAEAREHLARLDLIFASLGEPVRRRRSCAVVRELISAAREWTQRVAAPTLRDAGLAVIAQKIEHYKIASYRSARALAGELRRAEDEALLEVTLDEEKEVDHALAVITPALGTVPGRASFEYWRRARAGRTETTNPRGARDRNVRSRARMPNVETLLAVAPA